MTPLQWWVLVVLGVLGAGGTWFRALVALRAAKREAAEQDAFDTGYDAGYARGRREARS